MKLQSYRELHAWQNSMKLTTLIYRVTSSFPKNETYGLTSQIRRAAISIPGNIAEGQSQPRRVQAVLMYRQRVFI